MINLNDILRLDDLKNYKIRLNQKINEYKADEVYFNDKDRFKEANAYNGKNKQLNRPYLITFAEYSNHKDLWIFTGVYKVNDYKTKTTNEQGHALAQLEKIDDFEKFDGRLIVSFHKEMQAYVLKAEEFIERFQVHEICNEILNGEHFDNYYNIDLTFNQLNNIIRTQKQDWKTALENCKAVY